MAKITLSLALFASFRRDIKFFCWQLNNQKGKNEKINFKLIINPNIFLIGLNNCYHVIPSGLYKIRVSEV